MIVVDGSHGEGGGQILRTSLALSLVTKQAFRIESIRAGRKKPGLLHQHLTAVKAAARIGAAHVDGAEPGSLKVTFAPGRTSPGHYRFDVGTAGSALLVFQTILPALALSEAPSDLVLEGGTHNPAAPPFDFLAKAFIPVFNRFGPRVEAVLDRPGFYPAGGGLVRVRITPARPLRLLHLVERGEILSKRAVARIARLPRHVAERELAVITERLGLGSKELQIDEIRNSRGPGNVVCVEVESEHVTEVFTGFGARGVPAESVAAKAAEEAASYIDANVPVGPHLADQILVPLALAGGSFHTMALTTHSRTNMDVIRKFMDVEFEISDEAGAWRVSVGHGYRALDSL